MRYQGEVRNWDTTHGWITYSDPQGWTRNVFVHWRDVVGMNGYVRLEPGDRVEFEIETGNRGSHAVRVKVLQAAEQSPVNQGFEHQPIG